MFFNDGEEDLIAGFDEGQFDILTQLDQRLQEVEEENHKLKEKNLLQMSNLQNAVNDKNTLQFKMKLINDEVNNEEVDKFFEDKDNEIQELTAQIQEYEELQKQFQQAQVEICQAHDRNAQEQSNFEKSIEQLEQKHESISGDFQHRLQDLGMQLNTAHE